MCLSLPLLDIFEDLKVWRSERMSAKLCTIDYIIIMKYMVHLKVFDELDFRAR